jgi:hypothetical protein
LILSERDLDTKAETLLVREAKVEKCEESHTMLSKRIVAWEQQVATDKKLVATDSEKNAA